MPTFVIDASVLQASGEANAGSLVSSRCREMLDSVLKICFNAAISDEIVSEWNEHQSNFALKWRVAMASRGKLRPTQPIRRNEIRAAIESRALDANHQANIVKDLHLIEAALDTDKIVVSLDDTARKNFSGIATNSEDGAQLKHVAWVNPVVDVSNAATWFADGGVVKEAWLLGGH